MGHYVRRRVNWYPTISVKGHANAMRVHANLGMAARTNGDDGLVDSMRLLYCYVQFLGKQGESITYRGLDWIELSLSTTNRFGYDLPTDTLRCRKRTGPLPEFFWNTSLASTSEQTNIYNINVIAGENGSGKTTAMNCLIDSLDGFHAAVDPNARNRNRMEELGVANNRALLLLEENGIQYLLDYEPSRVEEREYRGPSLDGFSGCQPRVFTFNRWQDITERKDEVGEAIAKLLRRTKVIYLTNTLNQRDFERHIGERNKRLRDFFVYDASIGSTIGPDVAQFFPFEVYKQIEYVFAESQMEYLLDERQTKKNHAMGDGGWKLRLPSSLRIHLRTKLVEKVLLQDGSVVNEDGVVQLWGNHKFQDIVELRDLLGVLCVASFADNLRILSHGDFRPIFHNPTLKGSSILDECAVLIKDLTAQFILAFSPPPLEGHKSAVGCVAALSYDRVVSGSDDGTLRVWDVFTGKCLRILKGQQRAVTCVTVLDDGRIVSGSVTGTLHVWDVFTGECLYTLKGGVTCVASLPDERVVSGSNDGFLKVWDASTGECLLTFGGGQYWVVCVTAMPDGCVASYAVDRKLRVWDTSTGECLHEFEGNRSGVTCVAALPDGRIVSGSNSQILRVWDVSTGECQLAIEGHRGEVTCIAVMPDGRVVSGSRDCTVRVWSEYIWNENSHNEMSEISAPVELEQAILDKTQHLKLSCMDFIEYLNNDTLNLFRHVHGYTYELSLKNLWMTSNGEQQTGKPAPLYNDLITFIQKYRYTCLPTYTIDFDWGLSSGEENMLRIFANLYHVFDRDFGSGRGEDYRICNNESHSDSDNQKTPCDTILLFMDEADLTLHPEWQRRLISILTAFVPRIYPPSCVKDIQFIIATHSPLLLGDIPHDNITYLLCKSAIAVEDEEVPCFLPDESFETFGQNIHAILKESFFLRYGTIGDFAGRRINETAKRLKDIAERASREEDCIQLREELRSIWRNIQIVAPGVLRTKLELLYRDAWAAIRSKGAAQSALDVQQLLSDVRTLSKEDRERLLEALRGE